MTSNKVTMNGGALPVTMFHLNSAKVENGVFKVDRKFHVGMQAYAEGIRAPLITLHPEVPGEATMDPIEVPLSELPYGVMTFKVDRTRRPLPTEIPRLSKQIAASKLMYGDGFGCAPIAHRLGVPYILVLETDLQTQVTIMTTNVTNIVRRAVRAARCVWQYRSTIPDMRNAHSLHCNGYPIYDATRRYNVHSILYLDSRMAQSMVMPRGELAARLASRGRPMRLLFSGRYEPLKGTVDAVRVGVECLQRGLDIEMHLYGQGSLRAEMERVARQAPAGRIQIHDALPYPELVRVSRTFDLFVCCHIQSDPSCTYLESFGAGLPIVGYANRMWKRLSETSRVGMVAPMRQPGRLVDCVQRLVSDHETLAAMSERALAFAEDHCYEREFAKRINAVNEAIL